MFNLWKQHTIISYYALAFIVGGTSGLAYWLGYLGPKPLSILLGLSFGLFTFQISARMMIIFLTACVSFIALGVYQNLITGTLMPTIFGIVTAMMIGYSLTFSKGRWFIVLYAISLAVVAGIAAFFGLFLPAH